MMQVEENAFQQARNGEELPIAALETYLKNQFPHLEGNLQIKQYMSGYSNLTYKLNFGQEEWVLRRPPFGTKAQSAHDMGREFKVLSSIRPQFPLCPEAIHFCADESVIGSQFYLMSSIEGFIFRKKIPDHVSISPALMGDFCKELTLGQIKLHQIDYKSLGLEKFGKPYQYLDRQLAGWSKRYLKAKTPDAASMESVINWLQNNKPKSHERSSIVHNDYKFDNVIWQSVEAAQLVGILDWEMATIGDPLLDLGYSLAYWIEANDPEYLQNISMIPSQEPGSWTRLEIVEFYQKEVDFPWDNFNFYYIMGLFRLAGIVQQIYYRYYHGQTKDQRFSTFANMSHVLEKACIQAIERPEFV